jgi:hypothetical protein
LSTPVGYCAHRSGAPAVGFFSGASFIGLGESVRGRFTARDGARATSAAAVEPQFHLGAVLLSARRPEKKSAMTSQLFEFLDEKRLVVINP